MFQIQYIDFGEAQAIPITYAFFADAKRDANILKPERAKQIVNLKTGETVWRTPVPQVIPSFLKFN